MKLYHKMQNVLYILLVLIYICGSYKLLYSLFTLLTTKVKNLIRKTFHFDQLELNSILSRRKRQRKRNKNVLSLQATDHQTFHFYCSDNGTSTFPYLKIDLSLFLFNFLKKEKYFSADQLSFCKKRRLF